MVRRNGNRNSKIRVLRSKNMSTKKSEKIKDDFIIMKKLIKQKLDEWDTGNIQNEINKISILEDKPSGFYDINPLEFSGQACPNFSLVSDSLRTALRYMLSHSRKIGKRKVYHEKYIFRYSKF